MTRTIAIAALSLAAVPTLAEQEYLVAGSDSVQRYSLEGDYLGNLIDPGTTLNSASQFTLSPDHSTLYVGTFRAASNVSIFDARTGEFLGNLDDGGPLQAPSVVTFSRSGTLLVSDFVGGEVYEYDPETRQRLGTFFSGRVLVNPHEVLQVDDGYIVSDYGVSRIYKFNLQGEFERTLLGGGLSGIAGPLDMLLSEDDTLYVSNNATGQITVYDLNTLNRIRTIGAGQLLFPEGLAWAPDGSLVVANAGGGSVLRFDAITGELLDSFERVPGLTAGSTDVLLIPGAPTSGALLGLFALASRRRR